jgi:hypothetical protein
MQLELCGVGERGMAHRLGSVYKPLRVLALFFSSSRTHSLSPKLSARLAMSFSLALFFPKKDISIRAMSFLSPLFLKIAQICDLCPSSPRLFPERLKLGHMSFALASLLRNERICQSCPSSLRLFLKRLDKRAHVLRSRSLLPKHGRCLRHVLPFSALLLSPPKKDHQTHRG